MRTNKSFNLTEIFPGKVTLRFLVSTFLAVLELTRLKRLRIRQDDAFEDIFCDAIDEIPLETEENPNTVTA